MCPERHSHLRPDAGRARWLSDLDAFVDDFVRPLTCVQAISDAQPDERGITLRCSTVRIQRVTWERLGTEVEIGIPVGPGPPVALRIDLTTAAVLRFRFSCDETMPERDTPMLAGSPPGSTGLQVHVSDATITLRTELLRVSLDRAPFRMRVADPRGRVLVETVPLAAAQRAPTPVPALGPSQDASGRTSLAAGWPWFLRQVFPLGFVEDTGTGAIQTFDSFVMRPDEHFYGFGERFGPLDKRGQAIGLWQANAMGNVWPVSYKNVPFFMSTAGYGHFVNSAYPIAYHMGDRSHVHYSVHLQHRLLDYFLIAGPTFKDVLPRYTALTGRPQLPPLWSFGLWMSRMSYRSQDEVEAVASRLRAERIPCDVINIDDGWVEHDCVNDASFSPGRFPEPKRMLSRLREHGFRVSVWQIPYISTASSLYEPARTAGYFAAGRDGEPRLVDGFFGPAGVIDFSNPAAVAWYADVLAPLFDLGVAAIKTDFGEGAPADAAYHGIDGPAMHNLYPLLYNKAVFDITEQATGDKLVWARSAYAGSQRYPVHWGGDSVSRWEDLGNSLYGGLSLGMSGFPFWSQDIGGYVGTPTADLYVRWAQLGLFLTHARAHGTSSREPWSFGDQALEIFRTYAELRYRLLPYLWSEAVRCVRLSQPLLRPMVFDWQKDPSTYAIGDQFMLGEHLLVAPILSEQHRRKVYLPEGVWMDYWTSRVRRGPRWITVEAPLEQLPMFLRQRGVLPSASPVQHTGQLDWGRLTFDLFPGRKRLFVVDRSSVGMEDVRITHERAGGHVRLRLRGGKGIYRFRLRRTGPPTAVRLNGRSMPWRREGGDLFVTVDEPMPYDLIVEGTPPTI